MYKFWLNFSVRQGLGASDVNTNYNLSTGFLIGKFINFNSECVDFVCFLDGYCFFLCESLSMYTFVFNRCNLLWWKFILLIFFYNIKTIWNTSIFLF